jgi:hypothetical protein
MKKYIIIIFLFLLIGCAPTKTSFWNKKYPHETVKSYHSKRHLMLLPNTYLGRNKYFFSNHNTFVRHHRLPANKKSNWTHIRIK